MSVSDNDGALAGSNKIALSKEFDIAYIYAIEDIGKIVELADVLPEAGEDLYTVGSPIDGLVLSKGRLVTRYEDLTGEWLEIAIAADQGNSGGPVFSEAGLVGMVISKNLNDKRINAYSVDLLTQDYENLEIQQWPDGQSNLEATKRYASSPLLTQSISAIIAFIFGGIVGMVLTQRRYRRLNKKRIRIVVEN